jgi:hypothetical protein
MSRTTFSGPLKAGNIRYNQYKNVGSAVLSQVIQVPVNTGGLTATSTPIYIPAGSQIVDIRITTSVAYDSATSATLTVGKTATGTEYAGGNAKTAGLVTTTVTAAQATNWLATPSDVTSVTTGSFPTSVIYAQIISVGQPTVGNAVVTVIYTQPDDRSTFSAQ